MISKFIFSVCVFCSLFGFSQVKSPTGMDFFEFSTADYLYKVMIVLGEDVNDQKVETTVRVIYGDKMVEFYSITEFEFIDGTTMITIVPKDKDVKILKGSANYNPDTFLLALDSDGNFLRGESTDTNSTTGNKITFISTISFTEQLQLLKKFYSSDDPLYSKLMKIVKESFVTDNN